MLDEAGHVMMSQSKVEAGGEEQAPFDRVFNRLSNITILPPVVR